MDCVGESQGNHYSSRDYGSSASNQNSYHYSNSNGSQYYNDGRGGSTYTPPSGNGGSNGGNKN
ncbi:hypothetical protein HDU81_001210 [Chytriomyces hyalinus]|nr:hypothetical protein HDU81_001210 [Chytriomyces hyalinus]